MSASFGTDGGHALWREVDAREPLMLSQKIRTWIFDPPYNVNFRYGQKVKDNLSLEEYRKLIHDASKNMFDNSEDDANLFHINYPEQASRTLEEIERAGWKFKQWISWVYPSNMGMSKKKCTTAHRAVLWFVKGDPETDMKAVVQPYKNPNDKRIKKRIAEGHKGTHLYSWWQINMRKNVSAGYRGWFNQLPVELIRRIILLTTKEGEWVGDLMAGGCSTFEVARTLNRKSVCCDIDLSSAIMWKEIIKEGFQ